jgi:hypothetical protein
MQSRISEEYREYVQFSDLINYLNKHKMLYISGRDFLDTKTVYSIQEVELTDVEKNKYSHRPYRYRVQEHPELGHNYTLTDELFSRGYHDKKQGIAFVIDQFGGLVGVDYWGDRDSVI